MIIKSLSIKSKAGIKNLIQYMLKSEERLKDSSGKAMLLRHNLRSENIQGWVNEYLENEQYRIQQKSNSVYMLHEILSFAKEDSPHLSNKVLEDLARAYVELRADSAIVLGVAHHDRDHRHIHLAISGVNYRLGNSSRVSQQEFAQIKERMQELQLTRYPELFNSIVRHGDRSKKKEL